MNSLRLARTLQPRVASSLPIASRALATAAPTSTQSMIPVSNIEAQWQALSNQEQMEVYGQLLEAQKRDWKTLSIDEKKAAYYVSFGPHGPRTPIDEPGSTLKIIGLTTAIVGAAGGLFAFMRSFAPPPPKTLTKEWQEAANELAREEKSDPITGIASAGYKGTGHVTLKK